MQIVSLIFVCFLSAAFAPHTKQRGECPPDVPKECRDVGSVAEERIVPDVPFSLLLDVSAMRLPEIDEDPIALFASPADFCGDESYDTPLATCAYIVASENSVSQPPYELSVVCSDTGATGTFGYLTNGSYDSASLVFRLWEDPMGKTTKCNSIVDVQVEGCKC